MGVVRAAFGVAETGSVLLTRSRVRRSRRWASWRSTWWCLLDPARHRAPTCTHAYRSTGGFAQARYAILMTGPSATADIEGVLIHGAQGIRSLTLLPHAA